MAVDAADACRAERDDTAAAEEQAVDLPPEAKPFAVIMRTPGADGELAAGALYWPNASCDPWMIFA
jgi:formate dehydrogenase assembly factor FdhD